MNKEKRAKEAYAYTPGLKVKKENMIERTRLLPITGELIVKKGDEVGFETTIAKAYIPGKPNIIKADEILNVAPEDLPTFMVKKAGDEVEEGEIIAKYTPFWGLIKRFVRSPAKGTLEAISDITGQIILREQPTPIEINAYISGKIKEIIPMRGAIIETNAALIQGIFGIGGKKHGKLKMVAESPSDVIMADKLNSDYKGKIIIGGSLVTLETLRKAIELGVKGIIVGGISGADLKELIGYEIGVAITGNEDIGTTIIVTEGFGRLNMSLGTFDLLKKFDGQEAAIDGATQIRAGVIRPEIIIPHIKYTQESEKESLIGGMRAGTPVRIIREPYFGKIGTIVSLPVQLKEVETEDHLRVMIVHLDEGDVIVPRANVEIIER